jgi:DNA-binding SARP family transcriptional activator
MTAGAPAGGARRRLEFRVLGPLEVAAHDRVLDLGGRKQRSLLAVLLLHANDVVASERLIDLLWGEAPPATVAKSVQVYVSRLRKQLGDGRLVTRTPGYQLHVDPTELDLARFERLVGEARGAAPEVAAAKLRAALALWRGAPLADLAYEPFVQAEAVRLEELRLLALEQRIDAELATGRHAELVGELEAAVSANPLREGLRGQLMLALYRCGRQAEALEAYRDARATLTEELGIEPSRALRELHELVLRQDERLELPPARPPEVEAPSPHGAFVGREPELRALAGGLDEAFAGRGRMFLLEGEPGIGKSRLAEELGVLARRRGARVLLGRCWEAGGAPAYWPWVQSLRAYVRDADADALRVALGPGAAELAQILPELRERFPDLPEPAALEAETARFRLFDATAEFLRNASRGEPIVLVIDDLHAADASSLLLLRFLVRALGSMRVLVVGACRDVDPVPAGPVMTMLAEIVREPVTRRLSLGGLSEREVAEYVELTASTIASAELVAALHEEAEGNPLFVGEIVRLLAVEGVAREPSGVAGLAIPQTVRDVIARRLAHLSGDCNRVLALASVLGREFNLETLARLGDISEDDLLDILDEAVAARVVSDLPAASGRLRFAHVLIRDTLYEGLPSVRRVRLHRRVVDALEARYAGDPGPALAELAHHAVAGHDLVKGLSYAWRAADRALALFAWEEAARLYDAALAALDPSDERQRCELLLSRGEAEARAGDTPTAKRTFLEAAGIARRLGLARQLARAAAGYGGRIAWGRAGEDRALVPLLEEGLAALAEDDFELRARLLARLAGALRDEPSRDRRDALSGEAVELARRTGDAAALAYALDGRASAIVAPDTVAECLALGSELCEVAERCGDRERVIAGHSHRHIAQMQVGDVRAAELELDAMIAIADELKQPARLWQAWGARAMLTIAAGRLDEGEELSSRALALGERAQRDAAIPVYQLQRYTLCEFRGTLDAVEPAIRDLIADHPARAVFRCAHALLLARLGRLPETGRALEELAHDDFSALPFDQEWLFGMSLLAETAGSLGDAGSAGVVHRLLEPWAALNVVDVGEGMRGSVARYLGIAATTMRRWDEAERHFERAAAMNARMGARPWLAYTRDDHARMLLARERPGDRERARRLLDEAHAGYREIGMRPPSGEPAPHP